MNEDTLLLNIERLMNNVGSPSTCKGCGKKIWWVKHKNGKNAPYTEEALNHFSDCPEAMQFRKDRQQKPF